jgi:hypothetical protein
VAQLARRKGAGAPRSRHSRASVYTVLNRFTIDVGDSAPSWRLASTAASGRKGCRSWMVIALTASPSH